MDEDLSDTVIRVRENRAPKADAPDATDLVDEDTVVRPTGGRGPTGATRPEVGAPSIAAAPPGHAVHDDADRSGPRRAMALHRFRVNGGTAVPTDVATLIGRAPRAPRVPGGSLPRLVAVPSPAHEVSGTHLEVRQQGSSVVVTDLRSTNGTVISVPGSDRIALRPGESFVAGPGSLIDIGDGNVVEVLPMDRLVPDAHGRVEP